MASRRRAAPNDALQPRLMARVSRCSGSRFILFHQLKIRFHRRELGIAMRRRSLRPPQSLAGKGFDKGGQPARVVEHRRANIDEAHLRLNPCEYPALAPIAMIVTRLIAV